MADVVQPPDEGRDEGRPRLGRQQRLGGGKAQGHIDLDAVIGELLAGLEAIGRERHLDGDVVGQGGQRSALCEHRLALERGDFGGDRAGHDGADLLQDFREVAAGLGNQRGIGRDPIDQAGLGEIADFGDVRRIDEKAHRLWPKSFLALPRAALIALWRRLV